MSKKNIRLIAGCFIMAVFLLASCTPAVTKKKEMAPAPEAIPRGTVDPAIYVDIYQPDMA